ncbi:MAG: hypothetical protein OEX07_10165, partial [Gammaproteobacteria bacterium]|nr:hypothetical protein [Gammaproteobacteria bacterium]
MSNYKMFDSLLSFIRLFSIYFCLSIIFANTALADQYHYNNVLIGNRASGMAGAYVAVSDDPSGLYYNPSGIVYS